MNKPIAVILRRPPYGDINAAEAVRHAMGAASGEIPVSLILVDSGVLLMKAGQEMGETGFTNLRDTLKDCLDMGVEVYADRNSIREEHLDFHDVPDGVKAVGSPDIAGLIEAAGSVMIF